MSTAASCRIPMQLCMWKTVAINSPTVCTKSSRSIGGKLVDEQGHLDRLTSSLNELRIAWPVTPRVLKTPDAPADPG